MTADGSGIVGIALRHAKAKKHISPSLVSKAAAVGITIKLIDPAQPLSAQEPFDVLLHKIRDAEWHERVSEYTRTSHPNLRLVDPYDSVMQLTNRISMLDPVRQGLALLAPSTRADEVRTQEPADRKIWQRANTLDERRQKIVHIAVPEQVVLEEGTTPQGAREAAGNAGLSPPLIGKPLWADGREGSHGLLVLPDAAALEQLAAGPRPATPGLPVVLQEYVPHGACLFKVYVMGPITILVRRPSLRLPIAGADLLEELGRVQSVGRVSAYHSDSELGSAPQWDPPHWAVQALAAELRRRYGLTLFNFDLIQPERSQQDGAPGEHGPDFLLLDVNAFPGFEKLPDYEELFVLYLQSLFSATDGPERSLTRFVAHSHVQSPRDPASPE